MFKPKQKLLAFTLMLIMLVVSCEAKISLKSYKVGTTSKYVVSAKVTDVSGKTNTVKMDLEQEVLSWRKIGEQEVLTIKMTSSEGVSFVFLAEDEYGIYAYAEQGSDDVEPILVEGKRYDFRHPLKVGNNWSYVNSKGENYTSTIVKEEEVTVPAGNFKCLKIESTGKKLIEGSMMTFTGATWIDSEGYEIKLYIKGKIPVTHLGETLHATMEMLIQLSSRSEK